METLVEISTSRTSSQGPWILTLKKKKTLITKALVAIRRFRNEVEMNIDIQNQGKCQNRIIDEYYFLFIYVFDEKIILKE